ncbi:MAG: hypothetical protein GY774_00550 [Planctomycetes bacterium]|nr:hypothetical protein [Planctomycetota bacterium]
MSELNSTSNRSSWHPLNCCYSGGSTHKAYVNTVEALSKLWPKAQVEIEGQYIKILEEDTSVSINLKTGQFDVILMENSVISGRKAIALLKILLQTDFEGVVAWLSARFDIDLVLGSVTEYGAGLIRKSKGEI